MAAIVRELEEEKPRSRGAGGIPGQNKVENLGKDDTIGKDVLAERNDVRVGNKPTEEFMADRRGKGSVSRLITKLNVVDCYYKSRRRFTRSVHYQS